MRGFTGTGNSLLMTPLFAIIFGPLPAVAIVIIFDAAIAIPLMRSNFTLTRWRMVLPLVIGAWITIPIGTALLIYIDPYILKKFIAAVVICFSLILLSGWRYLGPFNMKMSISIGSLTGLFVGSTAMWGPIWTLYILSAPGDHHSHRAAFNSIISCTAIAVLVALIFNKAVSMQVLGQSAILFPIFISFMWIGSRIFDRASEQIFRRTVLLSMVAVGAMILFL